jgi:hypothetical protein
MASEGLRGISEEAGKDAQERPSWPLWVNEQGMPSSRARGWLLRAFAPGP